MLEKKNETWVDVCVKIALGECKGRIAIVTTNLYTEKSSYVRMYSHTFVVLFSSLAASISFFTCSFLFQMKRKWKSIGVFVILMLAKTIIISIDICSLCFWHMNIFYTI
jgi:hypothetical protein